MPDGPKTAETAKPESPDAQAKPAAAPEKKKEWSPPRFTARQRERDEMVQVIKSYGLADEAVLKAMAAVPRHEFVPEQYLGRAYGDHPLPIGYGQTISQPFIVAEMTRQLGLKPGAKVLEIGTGSAYQAAVLTHFTTQVYTMEIVKPLEQAAEKRLKQLGYDVVEVRQGDGFYGWPEKGPFDAVIVTCAVGQIPPPLIEQLKPGGRMVVPVGGPFSTQSLMLVEKDAGGKVHSRSLLAVAFVPLIREDPSRK
jgi:protein-L-isoaspartate(D-aspartate) O-methyltransferase